MSDTRTRILNLAEDLTQKVGFNGFSYLDLAEEIGVKNSSIHYHFKAKADLALALVERYRSVHKEAFEELDRTLETPKERLEALADHFNGYALNQKVCMCGMMAAEFEAVSPEVRQALALYFRDLQGWLTKQLAEMRHPDPQQGALQFVCALEGSLLLARLEGDATIVGRSVDAFVNG